MTQNDDGVDNTTPTGQLVCEVRVLSVHEEAE